MKIKIDVTEEDIKKGQKGISECCPIALACRRIGLEGALVGAYDIAYKIGNKWKFTKYTHTLDVKTFINRFDMEETVEPFSFEVEFDE